MTHEKTARQILYAFLVTWTGFVYAQPNTGEVTHWDDGSAMECPFVFEQEALLEWNQMDPPPVTIETAAAKARFWGEKRNLSNVVATSFRLIGVRPKGHDYPMLVMFVSYFGFPPNTRIVDNSDSHWIAITPTGTVVEPNCEGAP